MEKWIEQFSNHPVHGTIASIQKELDSLNLADDKQNVAADVERLRNALDYIRNVFDRCLSHLVNINVINKMNNNLTQVNTELVAFKQDNNRAHFDTINSTIDGSIQQAAALPMVLGDADGESVSSIISSFSKGFKKITDELTDKKKAIETEFANVKNSLSALQKDFKGLTDSFNDQQKAIRELSTTYQEQFAEQQESRRKEFAEKIKEIQGKIDELVKGTTAKLDEQKKGLEETTDKGIKELREKIDVLLVELKDKNDQASKLLESVGITTHTYGYAGVSQKEGALALKLRGYAIFFMLLAVGLLVGPSLFDLILHKTPFDWKGILYRIPTSIVVFIPAFYLAREASRHREVEVENKRIELELAALSPYLELFKAEDKNKIKEELVSNYFIGHNHNTVKDEDAERVKWLSEALPEIIEKVLDKVLDRIPGLDKGSKS